MLRCAAMSTALSREVNSVSLATQSHYIIRRKFWSVLERVFRVFTGDGQLIMYIQHPLLKLREEFTVYADEAQTRFSGERPQQSFAGVDIRQARDELDPARLDLRDDPAPVQNAGLGRTRRLRL